MKFVKIEMIYKNVLNLILICLFDSRTNRIKRSNGGMNCKIIIAVNSCDFLDNISFDCNIFSSSPTWNNYTEIIIINLSVKA